MIKEEKLKTKEIETSFGVNVFSVPCKKNL